MEDPIWLGEFLHSTNNASPDSEEWLTEPFKYRWYQRDLLSDQNEFISLVAGRSVGKCSPDSARIYTYPYGYVSIRDLLMYKSRISTYFIVYAINENQQLVQRRAYLENNGSEVVFEVRTAAGHTFEGTINHPILTPTGYSQIGDLMVGSKVAVATSLPHYSEQAAFSWEELRWLGYMIGFPTFSPERYIPLKYQK